MAEQLLLELKIDDQGTPTLQKFNKALNETEQTQGKANATLQNLAKGFDAFKSNLLGSANAVPGLSGSIGGLSSAFKLLANPLVAIPAALGAAAGVMAKFALSNADVIMGLTHMASKTGLTVNELNSLKKMGAEVEIPLESMVSGFGKLEKNLNSNAKELKKYGVTAKDPVEAMAQVADAFKKAESPLERQKIGMAALGRSWQELAPLLEKGGAEIRKSADASTISEGMVMRYESIHKSQVAISRVAGAWKTTLGDIASGPLEEVLTKFAEGASWALSIATTLRNQANIKADVDFTVKAFQKGDIRGQWEKMGIQERTAFLNGYYNMGAEDAARSGADKLAKVQIAEIGKWTKELAKQKLEATKGDVDIKPSQAASTVSFDNSSAEAAWKAERDMAKRISDMRAAIQIESLKDEREAALVALSNKFQDEQGAAQGNVELLKLIQTKYRLDILKINEDYDKKDIEARIKAKDAEIKKIEQAGKVTQDTLKKNEDALKEIEKKEKEVFDRLHGMISDSISAPLNTLVSSMGTWVVSMGRHGKGMRNTFRSVWSAMQDDFGKMIAKNTTEWIVNKAAMYAKDLALHSSFLTAQLGLSATANASSVAQAQASGAAITAAQAPAAAVSSVASFGTAAAVGGAALAAVLAMALSYHASGSRYTPGGMAIVGEAGPELVSFPRGSQVLNASDTRQALGGGDSYVNHITVNKSIDEVKLAKNIVRTQRMSSRQNRVGNFKC